MLLRVDVADRNGVALVTAAGEIDAATANQLDDAIGGALEGGFSRVVTDFAQVTFIDSTGLGVLVKSHRNAASRNAEFAVVHPSAQTLKLIKVLALDQLLTIYDNDEQAFAGS